MYYLDNAATTLIKPTSVTDEINRLVREGYGNPGRGAHDYSLRSLEELFLVRQTVNRFFKGPSPLKVVLTANITTALNLVIASLLTPDDHVITSDNEHNSVLRPLYQLESQGMGLSFLPVDGQGRVELDGLTKLVEPRTKALVLAHGSNVTGHLLDLAWLVDFCRQRELFLIIDGAQTAGCLPIDLASLEGPLIYAFTGHKSLYGPMGTGGLIIKGDYPFKQVFSGGSGSHSFSTSQPPDLPELLEYGTPNLPGLIGLKLGIEYLEKQSMEKVEKKLRQLTSDFYWQVHELPSVTVYGDGQNRLPIVSLNIGNQSSAEVADRLWHDYGIATRPGAHCAPRLHQALGTADRGMVRFSFSSLTDCRAVEQAAKAVAELARRM